MASTLARARARLAARLKALDAARKALQAAKAAVAQTARTVKRLGKHKTPIQAQGIDVSNNQGHVDFHAVKQAGYDFAYVKATEGVGFVDAFFLENVRAARGQGLKVGAYHFLRPRPGRTGVTEAREFAAALKRAGLGKGDLLPVVDVEVTDLSPPLTEVYVGVFVKELKRLTGRRPLIYTFPAFLRWNSTHGCSLWIANYDVQSPTIPGPWKGYVIWQHSSKAHVPGVGGNCDVNRCPDLRKVIA